MSIHPSSGDPRDQSSFKLSAIQANCDNVVHLNRKPDQADSYYHQAMLWQHQQPIDELKHEPLLLAHIHDTLISASELGHGKAPMVLVEHALAGLLSDEHHQSDVLRFLTLAADRKHPKAAYYLGASYAGTGELPQIEVLLKTNPNLHAKERERLAIYYLTIGANQQHQASLETLMLGYAYSWPYLSREPSRLLFLGKECVEKNNDQMTLALGAWLLGYTVDAEQIPETLQPLPIDISLGLRYLLKVSRCSDFYLATKALHVISQAIANEDLPIRWISSIVSDALNHNALLALYLAWYSLPHIDRPAMPELIHSNACTGFATVFLPSYEKASFYFNAASQSSNAVILSALKGLSRPIFSGYVRVLSELSGEGEK